MKRACYTRPAKPLGLTVKRREDFPKIGAAPSVEIVTVDRFTECHVTPADVAGRMVRYLGEPGRTLEPSAGTGNLSRALDLPRDMLTQVERHIRLSQGLDQFGAVVNRCFLEWAAEVKGAQSFARVIMNPPFSDVRKHVAAARGLLAPGGVLVALVPCTFDAPGMETLENLDENTFANAKVRTKIIRIRG